MSRSTSSRPRSSATRQAALLVVTALLLGACGLTVTQERPSYEELSTQEKSVVQTVLTELRGFNQQVETRTAFSIAEIIDIERINVSFEGNIFTANLGDGLIHVAPWDNLDDAQRALVAKWFGSATAAAAKATYEKLFYRFLAISQGAKQYMYEALTVQWVYAHRSLYNVERDTIRETLSYYRTIGKQAEMWGFTAAACKNLLATHRGKIPFSKAYLNSHFQDLANPKAPTGYLYYICEWIEMGKADAVDLTTELLWVQDIPHLSQ